MFAHVLTAITSHFFRQDSNDYDQPGTLDSDLGYSTEEDEGMMGDPPTGECWEAVLSRLYSRSLNLCSGEDMFSPNIDEFGIRRVNDAPSAVPIEDTDMAVTLEESFFSLNIEPAGENLTFESEDTIYLDPGLEPLDDDLDVPPPDSHLVEGAEELNICPGDDEEQNSCEVERFPRAGEVKAHGRPRFQELVGKQIPKTSDGNLFHPFKDKSEFELAKWLNPLPLTKIDEFLQLTYVCSCAIHEITLLTYCH
jgi:hypothetical protein